MIAQTLAADGARVAVMARGQEALDAATESLLAAGAPDAVGISVDMTDPDSIAAGFAEVGDRWGSLNILVHTIGPAAGRFEQLDDVLEDLKRQQGDGRDDEQPDGDGDAPHR